MYGLYIGSQMHLHITCYKTILESLLEKYYPLCGIYMYSVYIYDIYIRYIYIYIYPYRDKYICLP